MLTRTILQAVAITVVSVSLSRIVRLAGDGAYDPHQRPLARSC
jgi:hypothetical protein